MGASYGQVQQAAQCQPTKEEPGLIQLQKRMLAVKERAASIACALDDKAKQVLLAVYGPRPEAPCANEKAAPYPNPGALSLLDEINNELTKINDALDLLSRVT